MSSPPRPHVPHAALAAAGAVPVLSLLDPALGAGGLAPLAVATVVALFVGRPLASLEWRQADDRVRTALAELVVVAWVAAAIAALVAPWQAPGTPTGGAVFAVSAALGSVFAGARLHHTRLRPLVPLGLLAATVALATPAPAAPPWTLLEPHFETWRTWAPASVALGLTSAGAALGPLVLFRREPGEWRTPWASVGVASAVALAGAARGGTTFAAALGDPGPDVLRVLLGAAVLATLGPVALRRPGWLVVASLWLVGPAAGAAPFVATVLAPVASAALLGWSVARGSPPERAGATLAAVGLLGAAGFAGTWPSELGPAAAVGALVVSAFWWVATRLVVAPAEAT